MGLQHSLTIYLTLPFFIKRIILPYIETVFISEVEMPFYPETDLSQLESRSSPIKISFLAESITSILPFSRKGLIFSQ